MIRRRRRAERHVGAVVPVEKQREGLAILDAENRQRSHVRRVDLDLRDVAAFVGEGLEQEAPHLFVADAGDHRAAQPEARAAERDVARRAAEVFGEGRYVFQIAAVLVCV
jgi:hypothetical protein